MAVSDWSDSWEAHTSGFKSGRGKGKRAEQTKLNQVLSAYANFGHFEILFLPVTKQAALCTLF